MQKRVEGVSERREFVIKDEHAVFGVPGDLKDMKFRVFKCSIYPVPDMAVILGTVFPVFPLLCAFSDECRSCIKSFCREGLFETPLKKPSYNLDVFDQHLT